MVFDGWFGLLRVLVVGTLAYAGLLLMLRITGKRTLSKLNAFDLIVTVALGSTLATVLLSKDVALVEGLLAFALLCGLQFAVTWASVRWPSIRSLVKSDPCLVFYQGRFLPEQLRRERLTEDEVLAAIRASGHGSRADVHAVVLETDGSMSVIAAGFKEPADALNTTNVAQVSRVDASAG
jgi:uncharacterized membrane protein YcaP (DUF421 family)